MYGSNYLKRWSKTQATRALSSAEAELYSVVKTAAETIGIVSIFQDFNTIVKGCVLCDASAALGIVRRKGVGKTRHIDTGFLWIQEKNESKELRFDKVLGEANPADMYTKVLASDAIRKHMSTMGFEYADGKDDTALSINELVAEAADKAERLRESARSQPCRSNAKTFRWADCNSEEEQ